MITSTESAVQAVEKYVDIPEDEIIRAAIGGGTYDLQSLGKYLPNDLTTLKRFSNIQDSNNRAVSETDEEDFEIITLQDELDLIIENFNNEMNPLVPSLENVPLLAGMKVEDGLIYMSGCEIISQHSLSGIATAEVLIAMANGEDGETAAQRITLEIESMLGTEDGETSRALWVSPIQRWADGKVTYRFINMRKGFENATRKAMARWQTVTGGKVKFEEFNETPWSWYLVVQGILPIVRMQEEPLNNALGLAYPGTAIWGVSFLYLDPKCDDKDVPGRNTAYSVALHELGHVLGLQHEHQRWDRNNYLEVNSGGSNYVRIPEISLPELQYISLEWRSYKVWFVTIWYPVFVSHYKIISYFSKTSWDWNSIMLYSRIPVKSSYRSTAYAIQEGNVWLTKNNTELSALDIQFVKSLY
jgi:hypothetical protein